MIFLGTKVCVAFVPGSLICCVGRWAMVSKHLYVLTGFGMGVRVPHVFVHAHIYLQYSFVVFCFRSVAGGVGGYYV